ncbi:golgin subfamily A member 4 [Amyelois transitella]|uniref:golgin subfamily A member 4 n=1 Tax=Amyelois transitella TaxID=680683 RepID=UPI00298F5800|nr:golgin subfamily A member 4 [Amyelois transitella]
MFKKLKDKLAEEVKSSPQRIQQFAQAAQAAVTSASSSISDITNNDLFSIGDNDSQQSRAPTRTPTSSQNTFQEVPLFQPSGSQTVTEDFGTRDIMDNQKQRRLSNSSFASDVSFRLPSYESPSVYHLQSDMEISASEAEERSFAGGQVSLERVTKDQLYAAYRRTQERYTKYRTQYANLAHHYKLLERENAKARSVLVETQDKALRRISELREQCNLEQSAKAHLEKALRVDIEERNMKIEALNTQIALLQSNTDVPNQENKEINANPDLNENEQIAQLINLAPDGDVKQVCEQEPSAEFITLKNKVDKMEQLTNKYKESLKATKEKNAQLTMELQKVANELANKNQEIDILKITSAQFTEAKQRIHELNITNEELQNKINTYDFSKTKETSSLELELQSAKDEIIELNNKIDILTKREEENAISLAENKLSIHKELESKESEIKKLKDHLTAANKEIQSINIIVSDYKNNIALLEEEKTNLTNDIKELFTAKNKIKELETQIQMLTQRSQSLEQSKVKYDEEYNFLQLQMKQETAEKLAMIDRNEYLQNRNAQLTDENTRKSAEINKLENELQLFKENKYMDHTEITEKMQLRDELNIWKTKYSNLESEIQEERDELVKLQSEIEKLLRNHELIQNQNSELSANLVELKSENLILNEKLTSINPMLFKMFNEVKELQKSVCQASSESKSFKAEMYDKALPELLEKIHLIVKFPESYEIVHFKNQNLIKENNLLKFQLEEISKKQGDTNKKLQLLQTENAALTLQIQEYNELQLNYGNSQNELKENAIKQESIMKELKMLREKNANLSSHIQEYETLQNKYVTLEKQLKQFEIKQEESEYEISSIKEENEKLKYCLQDLDALQIKYKNLHTELNEVTGSHDSSVKELQFIKNENDVLNSKLEEYGKLKEDHGKKDETLNIITREYEEMKTEYEEIKTQFNSAQEQNKYLEAQLIKYQSEKESAARKLNETEKIAHKIRQECTEKDLEIENLEKKVEAIIQENISLKSQSEDIKMNAICLESEIEEVRRVHSIMESEKNRLNQIIEKLEMNQLSTKLENKETQLDESLKTSQNDIQLLLHDIESLNIKNVECQNEIKSLKDINSKLSNKILNLKVEDTSGKTDTDIANEQAVIKECEVLRDENRRLKLDIEGLQIYLTKISKENSTLNDRLREVIASSDSTLDKNELDVSNTTESRKEINSEKQTIDDLLRENSLLIEENLELKDQIQSQNYVKTETVMSSLNNNDSESANIKQKYDELLLANKNLEDRVRDLEQINRSVNGNVQHMQDGNQKLRLANEKLERRLDEALVSLRHLHSLQENTELEYLRNILYEYLTGSGTHSVTLAKVLAAVVKFDEKQTQVVLQKEKERQGVLHQFGLM